MPLRKQIEEFEGSKTDQEERAHPQLYVLRLKLHDGTHPGPDPEPNQVGLVRGVGACGTHSRSFSCTQASVEDQAD